MRWLGRVGVREMWAAVPEVAWGIAAAGAVTWGWIAPRVLPRADACNDRRTFAVALAVQVVLLVSAVGLTVVRGVRLRMSGGMTALAVGVILVPGTVGIFGIWFATGVCWNLTM
jgi:hypothetical protein